MEIFLLKSSLVNKISFRFFDNFFKTTENLANHGNKSWRGGPNWLVGWFDFGKSCCIMAPSSHKLYFWPFWNFDFALIRSKIWPPQNFLKLKFCYINQVCWTWNRRNYVNISHRKKVFIVNGVRIFLDFELCKKWALVTK